MDLRCALRDGISFLCCDLSRNQKGLKERKDINHRVTFLDDKLLPFSKLQRKLRKERGIIRVRVS